MDHTTNLNTTEDHSAHLDYLDRDDFSDTTEYNDDQEQTSEPKNAPGSDIDSDDDKDWPNYSDTDPDEYFVSDDAMGDLAFDAELDEFNPDDVFTAGWQSSDTSRKPAWRELERRREQMELERVLHDDLFDF